MYDYIGVARCQLSLQNILMVARRRGDGGLQAGGGGADSVQRGVQRQRREKRNVEHEYRNM